MHLNGRTIAIRLDSCQSRCCSALSIARSNILDSLATARHIVQVYQGPCHTLRVRNLLYSDHLHKLIPPGVPASFYRDTFAPQTLIVASQVTGRYRLATTHLCGSSYAGLHRGACRQGGERYAARRQQTGQGDAATLSLDHHIASHFSAWTEGLKRLSIQLRFHAAGITQRQHKLILRFPMRLFTGT